MRKAKFIAVFLFAILILAACSGQPIANEDLITNPISPESQSEPAELTTKQDGSRSGRITPDDGGGGGGGGRDEDILDNKEIAQNQVSIEQNEETAAEPQKPIERKIIRNATLELESETPEEAQQKITTIAEGKGGFVVTSTQRSSSPKTGKRDTVTMTLRVPAEKFNETLNEIRQTGSRVIVETISGKDVTEEFIDIQARLKAKKALEEQFLEIMKRSNTVEDALNVQRQLAEVRGEIEQIEGRLRFLDNQASLSTINVTLRTPTAISESSEGFFYRLTDSISTGLDGALSFILGFITVLIAILPFLLLIVLPIFLVLRYFFKKRKRKPEPRDAQRIVEEELKEE